MGAESEQIVDNQPPKPERPALRLVTPEDGIQQKPAEAKVEISGLIDQLGVLHEALSNSEAKNYDQTLQEARLREPGLRRLLKSMSEEERSSLDGRDLATLLDEVALDIQVADQKAIDAAKENVEQA